jgi:hypothetical protein
MKSTKTEIAVIICWNWFKNRGGYTWNLLLCLWDWITQRFLNINWRFLRSFSNRNRRKWQEFLHLPFLPQMTNNGINHKKRWRIKKYGIDFFVIGNKRIFRYRNNGGSGACSRWS